MTIITLFSNTNVVYTMRYTGSALDVGWVFSYIKCDGSELNIGHCQFAVNETTSDVFISSWVSCGKGKRLKSVYLLSLKYF